MGGAPDPPKAPKFHPIDINAISNAATQADVTASDWSYQDLKNRLPGLVTAQNQDILNAYNQIVGPVDPTVANSFLNQATEQTLGSVGGGDPMSGLALRKGSFAKGAASANVARQTMNYEDQNRLYLESLLAANPEQWYGLSGADIASLNLYNTGAANQASLANYQNAVSNANAAFAQQQAQLAAIGSAIGGIGRAYGNYQMYNTYNTSAVPSNYGQGFYG